MKEAKMDYQLIKHYYISSFSLFVIFNASFFVSELDSLVDNYNIFSENSINCIISTSIKMIVV